MDRGARKGRRQPAPDGREEEKAHHSFMAQRREGGSPSPQAHLSRTPRQQSWAEGRAARCARGVARQSHPAGRRGRESLKLMPYLQRAGRAARGGGGPATAKA
ncbi:hypothetical protein PVAP13_1NG289419 [Panicum virgatum]|uniref:Uncharacterized protein n=1 Tax=Panicum virgatum TaxID=38727 RepID=A0A8T0X2N5_PANVG|nr:hypothetical protein PVAP13_1NG289419 [Panicum virgatum]